MKAQLPIILGHVEKSCRERIRVAIDSYNGHEFIDIRVFALTSEGEKPTRQGVTVRLDRIRDLRRLLDSALEQIERPTESEPAI